MKVKSDYITLMLRIGLGIVAIYFGFFNIIDPGNYSDYVPAMMTDYVEANVIMQINGIVEIILGLFLLGGLYRAIVAILVGLHLLGIAALVWPADIAVRDFGLAIMAFAIACMHDDKYSLDDKWRKQILGHKAEI